MSIFDNVLDRLPCFMKEECTPISVPPGDATPMAEYLQTVPRTIELIDFLDKEQKQGTFSFGKALRNCRPGKVLAVLPLDYKPALIIANRRQKCWYFANKNTPWKVFEVDRGMVEHMTPGNDICVECRMDTGIPKYTSVQNRLYYVGGQGQHCKQCYIEKYGE